MERVRTASCANTRAHTTTLLQDVLGCEGKTELSSVLVFVLLKGDARLEIGSGPVSGLQDVQRGIRKRRRRVDIACNGR